MSDDPRRLGTQEAVDRLHQARRRGGECATCGRVLGADEPVYWEPVVVDIDRSDLGLGYYTAAPEAPLGKECASPASLVEVAGCEPGRCAECGRGVYYRVARRRRHRVACCFLCRDRAGSAERARAN